MAEARTFKRLKKTLSESYTLIKSFSSEQTSLEECVAHMKILEETYKECLKLEGTAAVTDENEKLFEDLYALHSFSRKRIYALHHTLSTKQNEDLENTSFSELCENQTAVLKKLLDTSRDIETPGPKIPSYSGNDYAEYQSFRNLFESLVNNNENIPTVRKLQILKGLCKDKAYNLIKHVEINERNYAATLKLLDDRFGRTKQLLTSYIKRFFEQSNISSPSASAFHQMYDTSMEILNGVNTLGNNAQTRDPWLILILLNKLDPDTRLAWANEMENEEFPTINQFLTFLAKRGNNMEVSYCSSIRPSSSKSKIMQVNSQSTKSCVNCQQDHYLYECNQFLDMIVPERRAFVVANRLCFNCLQNNHQAINCRSVHKCKICRRKHHTSLHSDENLQSGNEIESSKEPEPEKGPSSQICVSSFHGIKAQAILPTMQAQLKDASGQYQSFRALIDSGAQNSLITEKCVQNLSLQRKSTNIYISGISGHNFKAKGVVNLTIKSTHDSRNYINLSALIVPKLPPIEPLNREIVKKFHHLPLADPNLMNSSTCDLLIGADKCFSILKTGQHVIESGIIAQNTMFGWILVGGSNLNDDYETSINTTTINPHTDELENILKRFWTIEEMPMQLLKSPEDTFIEEFFITHTTRSNGRFTTRIPFKQNAEKLGDSYLIAKKRFLSIERKMESNKTFKDQYTKGIHDYLNKGHMRLTTSEEIEGPSNEVFFLPHHPVYKLDRETTKIRIVFDGSCKTTNGVSLNDKMMVGPVVQPTLWQTLMRFRLHPIALTADIEKMYLQINIHENDQRYQRLLWREDPNDDLRQYQLTTVTFGLASSPFLATRALNQIANEYENDLQIASEIRNSFYVDDYISGADDEIQAINLKRKITEILSLYGFPLRKFKSNSNLVCEKEMNDVLSFENSTTKVLGLQWCPGTDSFAFNVQIKEAETITKRKLLSESAQIYDPLGWLAPTILLFKILYQRLWMLKIDWDENLPIEIASDYKTIREELTLLQQLKFPRHMRFNHTTQLHGFSDASEMAYGAVIYARTMIDNNIFTILVTSKTKVAPTKPTSIARLELCAAQLLAKLISVTIKTLGIESDPYLWTDSKVVLAWLSEHPSHWKQFVANRCVQIQEQFPRKFWSYVSTKENPADYASRGVKPSTLLQLNQWWYGPSWLGESHIVEEKFDPLSDQGLEKERKVKKLNVLVAKQNFGSIIEQLFQDISSFEKIRQILSYILFYIAKTVKGKYSSNQVSKATECLHEATLRCIKWSQHEEFEREINELQSIGVVNRKSSIASLYPFIDETGIIRVGGRLKNANISFKQKHPAIIPKNHELGRKLIWHFHTKNLHCGPSLTLNIIQQQFWLIHGRSTIRKELRNCVTCFKHQPAPMQQLMGQLPSARVNLTRAFYHTGVDYAGPIDIATKPGRGSKFVKGFIAVFVCMSTKAVHLEAVSNLTTNAFLAALTRFASRRGVPHKMHSDNAKNFIGAKNRLNEVYQLVNQPNFNLQVSSKLGEQGIQWNFITPLAPHEGGLWEAAVKQMKSLLLKSTHGHHLTMEELSTMLCKIEAILNSRPLYVSFTEDVEYVVLTPNHFINGTASNLIPEEEHCDVPSNRLTRWQMVQKQTQYFARRYHHEYINSLQQRTKWGNSSDNIKIGEIVLLQDEQLPSYKWPLAKIINIYPDSDGRIRQVLVKTSSSILKRSIRKMCKIPIELTTGDVNGGEDVGVPANKSNN